MGETIQVEVAGGVMSAYLARPAAARAPAVVVLQEIFGVNKVMRDICDAFAKQGYIALCPDLFWRQEPGIQITDKTEAEWQHCLTPEQFREEFEYLVADEPPALQLLEAGMPE